MRISDIAMRLYGLPYKWGGSNYLEGFDCSGLVMEVLKSIGVMAHGNDVNSQGLYNWVTVSGKKDTMGEGALCFYGKSLKQISHVAIMLDDRLMLEAGGGDSSITNLEIAKKEGAVVRVRPYNYRKDFLEVWMPKYPISVRGGNG